MSLKIEGFFQQLVNRCLVSWKNFIIYSESTVLPLALRWGRNRESGGEQVNATTNIVFLRVNFILRATCFPSFRQLNPSIFNVLYPTIDCILRRYIVFAMHSDHLMNYIFVTAPVLWRVRTYRRSCSVGKFKANPAR